MLKENLLNIIKICWVRSNWKLILLIISSFISTCLELLGIGLVAPLIHISLKNDSSNNEGYVQYFESAIKYFELDMSLNLILIVILFIFTLKTIFVLLSDFIRIWITTGVRRGSEPNYLALL